MKQRLRPGIGVRLKDKQYAFKMHGCDCVNQRLQLTGVMGVIVIHFGATAIALELKPPASTVETLSLIHI